MSKGMDELANMAGWFNCKEVGHQDMDCPLKKLHISRPADRIQEGSQHPTSTAHNESSPAAQSLKIHEDLIPTCITEGSSATSILNSSAEQLLVTTRIAGALAKTLVDQQTAGADTISSKFCT